MGTRTVDDFYTGTKAAIAGGTTTIRMYIKEEEKKTNILVESFNLKLYCTSCW
jgi:dihydroorotase-like cyclic amidohydrolase